MIALRHRCPECRANKLSGKSHKVIVPVNFSETPIGEYDGYQCNTCGCVFTTRKQFQKIVNDASKIIDEQLVEKEPSGKHKVL